MRWGLFGRAIDERPAAVLALGLGAGDAGADPFDGDGALELGEHAQHLKQRPAGRRGGVDALLVQGDALLVQVEIAADGAQLAEKRHEVMQGAAEPRAQPRGMLSHAMVRDIQHRVQDRAARSLNRDLLQIGSPSGSPRSLARQHVLLHHDTRSLQPCESAPASTGAFFVHRASVV